MGDVFQYCIMDRIIKDMGLGDEDTDMVLHFLALKVTSHISSQC